MRTTLKYIAIFNTVIDNLEFRYEQIYTNALNGIMHSAWVSNIVDSSGKPYSTTVASKYNANKVKYEEGLALLEEWFALTDAE